MNQGGSKSNIGKVGSVDLETVVDARILRTRELLKETILKLSESNEVSDISVTMVARMAGINRSTFYQHASSPEVLLSDVLSSELASIRKAYMPKIIRNSDNLRRLIRIGMSEVLDYLLIRENVIRRHLNCSSPSMHNILAQQIEQATLELFRSDILDHVGGEDDMWPIAAAYHAHGVAAAVLKWLDRDDHRDRAQLEDLLEASLPNWFPRTD